MPTNRPISPHTLPAKLLSALPDYTSLAISGLNNEASKPTGHMIASLVLLDRYLARLPRTPLSNPPHRSLASLILFLARFSLLLAAGAIFVLFASFIVMVGAHVDRTELRMALDTNKHIPHLLYIIDLPRQTSLGSAPLKVRVRT